MSSIENYLQTKFGAQDVHDKIIGALESNSSVQVSPCLKGYTYWYQFPICWFRTLPLILMLDTRLKQKLLTTLKQGSSNTNLDSLRNLIYSLLNYKSNSGNFYLVRVKNTNEVSEFTLDNIFLYMMFLLNKTNGNKFPYTTIAGGYGRRNFIRFFKHIIPEICSLNYQIITISKNTNIITDLTKTKIENDILIIDYGKLIESCSNKLALYVICGERVYGLTSLLITGFKIAIPFQGHQFPIFNCQGRYYCPEMDGSTIGDVNLIETLLWEEKPLIRTRSIVSPFNLNKYQRCGIYQQCELDLNVEELKLLQTFCHNMRVKKDYIQSLSILMYFMDVIYISWIPADAISPINEKTTISAKINDTNIEWKLNSVSLITLGIIVDLDTYKVTYSSLTKTGSFTDFLPDIKTALETQLGKNKIIQFGEYFIRYPRHSTILKNIFDMMYSKQTGGKISEKIRYKKREYIVRSCSKGKYIMYKKEKTLLKTIRRQYRWVK